MRRLVAIGLVWLGCAVAWVILGTTLVVRSGEVSSSLTEEVYALWGGPMVQRPPSGHIALANAVPWATSPGAPSPSAQADSRSSGSVGGTQSAEAAKEREIDASLEASSLAVKLAIEQRQKGLLWFPTYAVDFVGRYTFQNPSAERATLIVRFPLEAQNALYDGFEVVRDDGATVATSVVGGIAEWRDPIGPKQQRTYRLKYRSRGTSSFTYALSAGTNQVKSFELVMDTDFANVDFPASSVSPTLHRTDGDNWHGEWRFKTLLTSSPIGVVLPEKLNPGPLAARITFFAPVGLLFFFFVVAILGAAREKSIHPLNYFFLGCAFFAFHLLFSYLVDHVALLPAFLIATAVSLGLVVSYARLFVGFSFAVREIGTSQLIYLVLFSFTFFWKGFTGLAVTVGAIVTLFLMMQLTGKKRWGAPPEQSEPRLCPAPYRCAERGVEELATASHGP